jgi:endo-1,4-beta-mannosidase
VRRRVLSKVPDKPFLVGANYWASHAAHRMWERWDPDSVERDIAFAESIGLNALRSFFWSPQLNPWPGVVNEEVLDRFEEFLQICRRHNIGIFPTLFVGHMSGTDWDIPWRQGRDFCADPFMIYWEADLVRRIVSRFKGNKTILGWILTNELPNYTGSLPPETATVWTRAMYQAVKEADPEALVSTGDGARCEVRTDYDGFRVEWVKDHVDWIGVHLYNYFLYEQGDSDDLRKAYHIPCRLRYVDVDKPVFLEEFGLSDLISGREEAAGYYRSVLYSSFANGACGALAWCLTDFDLPDEIPYSFQPHELKYGVGDVHYNLKPQGRILQDFARFASERKIHRYQMKEPAEAIFVPYYMYEDKPHHNIDRLRSYRLLEQTFTMAKMAGLNPDFLRECESLDQHRFLLLTGGARLKSHQWLKIEEWVRDGGSLLYTYTGYKGGIYAQNFETLFGCRQRLRFGQLEQPEEPTVTFRFLKDFGDIAGGEILEISRGRLRQESAYLPVEARQAEVMAEDNRGRPALLHHRLGRGRVTLCTYPIDYMLINTPDGNLDTPMYRIYGAAARESGIKARFENKHPYLEAVVLKAEESDQILIVVNHVHRQVRCSMKDTVSSQMLDLEMESKGVRLFEHKEGQWILLDSE